MNPELATQEHEERAVGPINPCSICAHSDYATVDNRCSKCGLRDKRFFEVIHSRQEEDKQ